MTGQVSSLPFHLDSARKEFDDLKVSFTNPELIDDELSSQKLEFEKLKFMYLELETKDKFLRWISESDIKNITQDELYAAKQASDQAKSELEELENQLHDEIQKYQELTLINNDLYNEYQDKIKNNARHKEIEILQKELDQELSSNPHSSILKSFSDQDFTTQLSIESLQHKLDSISSEIDLYTKYNNEKSVAISNLKSEIEALKKFTPQKNIQLYAQWSKEMIEILLELSNLNSVNVEVIENNLNQISISWSTSTLIVIYTNQYKIVKITGTQKSFPKQFNSEKDLIDSLVEFVSNLSLEGDSNE